MRRLIAPEAEVADPPRITNARQDRHIRLRHLRDRFQMSKQTAADISGLRRMGIQKNRALCDNF